MPSFVGTGPLCVRRRTHARDAGLRRNPVAHWAAIFPGQDTVSHGRTRPRTRRSLRSAPNMWSSCTAICELLESITEADLTGQRPRSRKVARSTSPQFGRALLTVALHQMAHRGHITMRSARRAVFRRFWGVGA